MNTSLHIQNFTRDDILTHLDALSRDPRKLRDRRRIRQLHVAV